MAGAAHRALQPADHAHECRRAACTAAAELVKLASTFPQRVTVNGTDATSLLAITRSASRSAEVEIASDDPDGAGAVEAIADLAESGFDEH